MSARGGYPQSTSGVFPMGSGVEALGHTPWRGVSAQLRDCTTRMLGAAQTNPRMPPAPLDFQSSSRSGRRAYNFFPFSHAALIPALYQLPKQASKGYHRRACMRTDQGQSDSLPKNCGGHTKPCTLSLAIALLLAGLTRFLPLVLIAACGWERLKVSEFAAGDGCAFAYYGGKWRRGRPAGTGALQARVGLGP